MYELHVAIKAKKDIKLLSLLNKDALLLAFGEIKEDPYCGKPLMRDLSGKFSYKIGVYRIIYIINEDDGVVEILSAGHRSIIYN